MSNSATLGELISDTQLSRFAKLIYETTGIRISEKKKALITNRLRKRLQENGLDSYDAYYNLVSKVKDSSGNSEWNLFLESITTHETYLYRDENQWKWFTEEYLPKLEMEANSGKRRHTLNIWSAACSRGDEAYTMASCLAGRLKNPEKWQIEIFGTDIGCETLEQARKAEFCERSMQGVPARIRRNFFQEGAKGKWTPKPLLQGWTNFQQHNLVTPLRALKKFDLVCLKNVLIYFDADSKKMVLENIYKRLVTDGYLMVGPTEGVTGMLDEYERVQPWLYRKTRSENGEK